MSTIISSSLLALNTFNNKMTFFVSQCQIITFIFLICLHGVSSWFLRWHQKSGLTCTHYPHGNTLCKHKFFSIQLYPMKKMVPTRLYHSQTHFYKKACREKQKLILGAINRWQNLFTKSTPSNKSQNNNTWTASIMYLQVCTIEM